MLSHNYSGRAKADLTSFVAYLCLGTADAFATMGAQALYAARRGAKSRFQNLCHARKQISAQPKLNNAWCIWALRS